MIQVPLEAASDAFAREQLLLLAPIIDLEKVRHEPQNSIETSWLLIWRRSTELLGNLTSRDVFAKLSLQSRREDLQRTLTEAVADSREKSLPLCSLFFGVNLS